MIRQAARQKAAFCHQSGQIYQPPITAAAWVRIAAALARFHWQADQPQNLWRPA
jgi:hypothetical protein